MEKTIWVNGYEFVLVEAESISLGVPFMKYEPQSYLEQEFKVLLTEVIRNGVKNFYRPKCDPSFTADGKGICFAPGFKPAVGKSYDWWEKNSRKFCPERKSRLGVKNEYVAFCGTLIKKLVESGWEVATAWNAVAYNSKTLGHYSDSEGSLRSFELTGSREICGFCDLANAYKLVSNNGATNGSFILASHSFYSDSWNCPIADIIIKGDEWGGSYDKRPQYEGVGWPVLEK